MTKSKNKQHQLWKHREDKTKITKILRENLNTISYKSSNFKKLKKIHLLINILGFVPILFTHCHHNLLFYLINKWNDFRSYLSEYETKRVAIWSQVIGELF